MGHRAQKKYSQSSAEILEYLEYLAEVTKGIEHDTELIRHKLNQMDGDIGLVMENQCAISAALEGVNNKQDRIRNKLEIAEIKQDRLIRKLDKLENSIMLSLVTILITVFAVVLILA